MRRLAQEFSALGVTEIARTVCELVSWKRPSGGLKNHECRQLLERLAAEGFLTLPSLRELGGRGRRRPDTSGVGPEPAPVECGASQCDPLQLHLVEGPAESRRWREHMERYHYLGCCVPFGAHLRYWVCHHQTELACLLWTSPAWKMQARDAWIGWSEPQRKRHLQSIGGLLRLHGRGVQRNLAAPCKVAGERAPGDRHVDVALRDRRGRG